MREKRPDRVIIVGVAGPPGSGKTTFARKMHEYATREPFAPHTHTHDTRARTAHALSWVTGAGCLATRS